jgi:hypothetical protein
VSYVWLYVRAGVLVARLAIAERVEKALPYDETEQAG